MYMEVDVFQFVHTPSLYISSVYKHYSLACWIIMCFIFGLIKKKFSTSIFCPATSLAPLKLRKNVAMAMRNSIMAR